MAISNDELSKSINLMTKVLTDFQYQNKLNGNNVVNTLEKTHRMLARASTETGLSPESLNKLLLKFSKSTNAIGDQAKLTQVLTEFNKKSPDYQRLSNIMTPGDFEKFVNRALEKIKNTPIKLNNKENLSFMSKAIAKANKDYASTGFGRVASDFYKNATNAQLKELRLMRKSIESGDIIGKNKGGMVRGLLLGLAGQTSDLVLENAGMGELPGKMMNLVSAIDALRQARGSDKAKAEAERNAALLANSRLTEASYSEQKRTTKESKELLIDATLQKDELTNGLLSAFREALNKTDLSDKIKLKYEKDLSSGKLTQGQLNKITSSWKKSLGDDITIEDKQQMREFKENVLSNISTISEINESIATATESYNREAKKELDSLITATKARADVDEMIFTELEGQFKNIDKELSSRKFRGKSESELRPLREQLQTEVVQSVSNKYGIAMSEARGMFNDHSLRVSENLSDLGIEASKELTDALSYNQQFAEKLAKLSSIFEVPKVKSVKPVEKTKVNKVTKKSPNTISSVGSKIYMGADILAFEGVPELSSNPLGTPATKLATPVEKKSTAIEKESRQDALETFRSSEKRTESSIKLLEKVFGENGDKSVKVQITNWPVQPPIQSRATPEPASVPSAD